MAFARGVRVCALLFVGGALRGLYAKGSASGMQRCARVPLKRYPGRRVGCGMGGGPQGGSLAGGGETPWGGLCSGTMPTKGVVGGRRGERGERGRRDCGAELGN